MHVLILNQVFHPDTVATGQLMHDLGRHLVAAGHRVSVIAGRGFYGSAERHPRARELVNGIDVHRVGWSAMGKRSTPARMVDFAGFYAAATRAVFAHRRPDVVLALTSPPMIATLAAVYRRLRGVPFVYHVMDLYPDALVAGGMLSATSPVVRALRAVTAHTLASATGVIALGRDMRDRILREYPRTRPDRVHIVPPWADGAALRPLDRQDNPLARELGLVDTFKVVYSGNLGVAHDVDTLVAAIRLTASDPSFQWIFIGGGTGLDRLRGQADAERWANVRVLPFQERARLSASLNLADVHLVTQLPAFAGVVVPSKLSGILAVGRPTILVGPPDADGARIVTDNRCGHVVPNGDAGLLVARLSELRDRPAIPLEMGHRARAAFDAHYDLPVACGRIRSVLERVAGAKSLL